EASCRSDRAPRRRLTHDVSSTTSAGICSQHHFLLALWDDGENDFGLPEIGFRYTLYVDGGDGIIPRRILLHVIRISDEIVIGIQDLGFPEYARQIVEKIRLVDVLCPLQLALRHAVADDVRYLRANDAIEIRDLLAGLRREVQTESSIHSRTVLEGSHALRSLLLVDKLLVQTRVLVVGQDLREDVERCVIPGVALHRMPGVIHARKLDLVLEQEEGVSRNRNGGNRRAALYRRSPRNFAEVLGNQPLGFGGIEIAGDDERRVVGRVVRLEKVLHVGDGSSTQIGHGTDDWPGVWVRLGVQRCQNRLLGA